MNTKENSFAQKLFGKSTLLMKAATMVIDAHEGQTRADNTTPYVFHVLRVAHKVQHTKWGEVLVCTSRLQCVLAAMCHDILEDTNITADELKTKLVSTLGIESWSADHVVAIVKELTQDQSLPKKIRRQKMIDHCKNMRVGAKLVKLADRLDNISTMKDMSKEFKKRYCQEARLMLKGLGGTCPDIEHQLVEQVTRNEILLEK